MVPQPMSVPLFATRRSVEPLLPAIAERMRDVLEGGRYILGPEVEAFESEFADYLGTRHCVGVGNGTDAITIALRALGVEAGDEVVVPAISFYATAEAVVNAGGRPVFADVDPKTWNLTAATVEPVLSERTAAIVPVHLFGNPAPVHELADLVADRPGKPVRILEDAAQAAGAKLDGRRAGSLADAATFSFYPSKNLGAFGDGGAIVTDDPDVAKRSRHLRFHGSADKVVHHEVGYNSRLDELQAAALRIVLAELDDWTAARRAAADTYRELGLGDHVQLPVETEGGESCYHLYVISARDRDRLSATLSESGIGNRVYYTPPLHEQPGMRAYAPDRRLEGAARFTESCLALPMGTDLSGEQLEQVVGVVRTALGQSASPSAV
jgi:dTDP-3-amino-3,4,6-trideoxy-alpha-D-glucose transaminase